MGFGTTYRFSVHAVIFNEKGQVLLLKQAYGDGRWGLPGGGVEPGETVYEAIRRECLEELGTDVEVVAFTGLYYHSEFNAQVGIFRCAIQNLIGIKLSPEHTEYRFFDADELGPVQRIRVKNARRYGSSIGAEAF